MSRLFQKTDVWGAANDDHVEKNVFIDAPAEEQELPKYEDIKSKLPKPIWDGHDDTVKCYDKAWEIAFKNIRKANPDAKFVSNFIDTAFNGFLFMWDSSFIVMFGKYASNIFNFQKTLDNLYSHQHRDGFICREICESEYGEQWSRDDPCSTGPNVLPWAEWEYYEYTADKERLSKVFDPLIAYHHWLQLNRTWQDGTYWSSGLACGMDNQPRQDPKYHPLVSHGFMSWIDICAQQYLSGQILIKMAKVLGREDEVDWLKEESEFLKKTINEKMWSDKDNFYYDTRRNGELSGVKTIGAYWTLLAGLVPKERLDAFVAHLDNENEFKRPNRVPTLSADNPSYDEWGGYWKGGVWAPTNYMVLRGLHATGYDKLAYEIACDYVANVTTAFNNTGTLWENYSPEHPAPGGPAKGDFVGWTGLAPINCLFEYVFGIHTDAQAHKIVWNINRLEKHGVVDYPMGEAVIELVCEARSDAEQEPNVTVKSPVPVTIEIHYGENKVKTLKI